MKNYPLISIVIPVKNEEASLGQCLKSLKQLNYPRAQLEIIISDGLSTDGTAEIAKSYEAKVVKNEGQTVASGRNVGFQRSRGDFIAFSDADCVMDKDWLDNALKYFEDEKAAGVGGPNIAPENETLFGKAVRFLFLFGSKMSNSVYVTDLKKVKMVKHIPGCNAIYKREALEKVMPIDETLLTCDDTEMNYQLMKKGGKLLFAPDVIVRHYRRDNPKKFWNQIYRYAIGRLQLGKKHKDAMSLIHIAFGLVIPAAVFLLILSLFINPFYALFLIIATLAAIAFFSVLGLIKEKSLKLAPYVFLAAVIFVGAWSLGFTRELLFPIKEVAGK